MKCGSLDCAVAGREQVGGGARGDVRWKLLVRGVTSSRLVTSHRLPAWGPNTPPRHVL